MSVALTQSGAAGFVDRPVGGGMGLRVQCAAGDDGSYLAQEMDEPMSVVHVRVMLHVEALVGGRVVLLRGLTDGGEESWRVTVEGEGGTVELSWAGGAMEAVALAGELGWQCVECAVDVGGGTARMWLNGRQVGSGSIAGVGATVCVWIGGVFKDAQAVGEVWLDEWVIADQYIGPVLVGATREDASDAARWVVIYNAGNGESVEWAEWYRGQRGLAYANLIGLDLSGDETIDESEFEAMRDGVAEYLLLNGLSEQVFGIVCGHGVPGQYVRGDGKVESVSGRMYRLEGEAAVEGNPLFDADEPRRMTEGNRGGLRLTARIDGATAEESRAITERAKAIEEMGLGDGRQAKLWLDAVTPGSSYEHAQMRMMEWAEGTGRGALRLPVEVTEPTEPASDVSFGSIYDDGFFVGWRAASVPTGFFGEPAGRRVFAIQLDNTVATAASLRGGECWARSAMEAGYAATGGTSRVISVTAVADAVQFFEALRRGWTLGEAWSASLDVLGEGLTLVGDPLMKVRMPRAGWNVYGPFENWGAVRFERAGLMLREEERAVELKGAMEPGDGRVSIYVVRHVDGEGREEAGVRHVRVGRVGTRLREVPGAMSWPMGSGWWPGSAGGEWVIEASWPTTLGRAGVSRVRLMEQVEGEEVEQVLEVEAGARSRGVTLRRAMSGQTVRYRVDGVGDEGAGVMSGWSAWVRAETVDSGSVMLLGEGM